MPDQPSNGHPLLDERVLEAKADPGPPPSQPAPRAVKMPAQAMPSIVVMESVWHRLPNEQPRGIQHRFNRVLTGEDQLYERKLRLTEDWQRLDLGWLTEVSAISIVNEEGSFRQTVPSPEMVAQAQAKVIEVSLREPTNPFNELVWRADLLVLPKESSRFTPANPRSIWLRSRSGPARCSVTAFPA